MKAEDAVHKISLGEVTIERLRPPLASEIVAAITNRTVDEERASSPVPP
jgi:hypothetical protein